MIPCSRSMLWFASTSVTMPEQYLGLDIGSLAPHAERRQRPKPKAKPKQYQMVRWIRCALSADLETSDDSRDT